MQRSTIRILTTLTGSLPRPEDLLQMLYAREDGQLTSEEALEARICGAVNEIVGQEVATGIDIVSDGEMSKIGFANYVKDRLSGFDGPPTPWRPQDLLDHKDFMQAYLASNRNERRPLSSSCIGPVTVRNKDAIMQDIANLRAVDARYEEAFISAASPGVIAQIMGNAYYASEEEYLYALADAMRYEYRAITDAGFLLQVDCPDLAADRHMRMAAASIEEFRAHLQRSVEVLKYALAGISEEQVRIHVCWGNYSGPHDRDVELKDIIDYLLQLPGAALSIEAANPRHEHEWALFEQVRLPEGKVLIPGMLDTCTNYIEHPALVAQRIVRWARLVGRENIIAGTDCGFATNASGARAPSIVSSKLASLVEGARLASQELW